jgi:hypothetical protein
MRTILAALLLSFLSGCATHFSTLNAENSPNQFLLTVPEEQAFQIAFSSLSQVLPGYEITDIDGPIKGYSANFRFVLDTYSQQVMVIPASGKTADGNSVRGYYFEVSGTGSSGQGRAKNVLLFETVSASAKATGKYVPVSNVNRESYVGADWRQGQAGRGSFPAARAEGADALTQIERLQQLRDRGAITDEEFQIKKKELLGRI